MMKSSVVTIFLTLLAQILFTLAQSNKLIEMHLSILDYNYEFSDYGNYLHYLEHDCNMNCAFHCTDKTKKALEEIDRCLMMC